MMVFSNVCDIKSILNVNKPFGFQNLTQNIYKKNSFVLYFFCIVCLLSSCLPQQNLTTIPFGFALF